MDWHLLKNYLSNDNAEDELFIQHCWSVAKEAVDNQIGTAQVPPVTYTQAVIEVGAAYFNRRRAQLKQGDGSVLGTPVFASKDALNSVYPMLKPYLRRF